MKTIMMQKGTITKQAIVKYPCLNLPMLSAPHR
jgi:hypothetical protein